jgi:flagellar assembly factor FliW
MTERYVYSRYVQFPEHFYTNQFYTLYTIFISFDSFATPALAAISSSELVSGGLAKETIDLKMVVVSPFSFLLPET